CRPSRTHLLQTSMRTPSANPTPPEWSAPSRPTLNEWKPSCTPTALRPTRHSNASCWKHSDTSRKQPGNWPTRSPQQSEEPSPRDSTPENPRLPPPPQHHSPPSPVSEGSDSDLRPTPSPPWGSPLPPTPGRRFPSRSFSPQPAPTQQQSPDLEVRHQQPYGLYAPDPGRFYAPYEAGPHNPYASQVAGRQRVFTIQDPPTRRDIAEAFVHIQHAARHSPHIGKREITELQLLECFVQVWDCRCTGLPNRDKLRIFDRVRLLYHVAQSGWGAALDGYADPCASLLLGPPVPTRRPNQPRATSPDRAGSPSRTNRPATRSQRTAPKSPRKPKK
ncbi:unnamed protein product, partial [Ixodes pacificus]